MKARERKASKAEKASRPATGRRRWRFFGRGRNRRLKRSTQIELEGRDQAGGEERSTRQPRGQRLKALLGAAARFVVVIAALGAIGAGSFFGYRALRNTSAFDVKVIEIEGARNVLPADLRDRAAAWRGISIFAVDREALQGAVEGHPWVRQARVVRELPDTLRVLVEEERAVAAVLLDAFYLVNEAGELFKRASQAEADGLPVITGPTRAEFVAKRQSAEARIRLGLKALGSYQQQIRPALSEVHVGARGEVTFFLRKSGTALRFGRMLSRDRLRQLDAVWAALGSKSKRARALYLDHEVRANRVIVRMNDDRE